MRHLFIVDPLPQLLVNKDTSVVIMREASQRGHEVFTAQVEYLDVGEGGRPRVRMHPTQVRDADPWFETSPSQYAHLQDFDVIWMRTDPPYDMNYFYATHLLDLAPASTLVLNDPKGLREVGEKLFVLHFPDICPDTLISRQIDELLAFRDKLGGEMVIKPLGGCGGVGVFHLTSEDRNVRAILEMATRDGAEYQVAQRYIPEVRNGDKRIILLDGEPIGAVLRVPAGGESRANFHAGGRALRAELTPRDREICARIGPALREHGIFFAGIDVIGDWLTEINVTSPTGVQEINALDGVRLEAQILDGVEKKLRDKRGE